jgi:Rrf2 family protein
MFIHKSAMLSQTVEYSLRAVVWLAERTGLPTTNQQIAEATKVPADYLAKIMQTLSRRGIVSAQRGKKGGFLLTRPADQVTVLEVINAVDPIQRIHSCPLALAAHAHQLCPLHRRLDDAMLSIETAFGKTTIAEILAEPSTSRPLCEVLCA